MTVWYWILNLLDLRNEMIQHIWLWKQIYEDTIFHLPLKMQRKSHPALAENDTDNAIKELLMYKVHT